MEEVPVAPAPPLDWGTWGKDRIERNYSDYLVREIRLGSQLIRSWVRLQDHRKFDREGNWNLSDPIRLEGEVVSIFDIQTEHGTTLMARGSVCSLCARWYKSWIGYEGKPWYSNRCNDCCKAVERAKHWEPEHKGEAPSKPKKRRKCPTCHQQVVE